MPIGPLSEPLSPRPMVLGSNSNTSEHLEHWNFGLERLEDRPLEDLRATRLDGVLVDLGTGFAMFNSMPADVMTS